MKRGFYFVGVIVSVLAVAAILGALYVAHQGSYLDAESKGYVDDVIPRIVAHWDPQLMINESSPALIKVAPDEQIWKLCAVLKDSLGPLKEYKGAQGEARVEITPYGKITTAQYIVHAAFTKKDATFHVGLIRESGKWQLLEFSAFPDL
jgi:hypothetical protein